MSITRALLVSGLVAFSGRTAMADDVPACTSFAWSVARERTAFAAPDLPAATSGSALPGGVGAAQLTLKPIPETTLLFPSEKAMKPGTFAGSVKASVPTAGTYQVTLSDEAWIDVSQDGRSTLKPSAHSGKVGCPDVRKSLRFVLDAGAVTIEVSRAPIPQIKLDLLKAEVPVGRGGDASRLSDRSNLVAGKDRLCLFGDEEQREARGIRAVGQERHAIDRRHR